MKRLLISLLRPRLAVNLDIVDLAERFRRIEIQASMLQKYSASELPFKFSEFLEGIVRWRADIQELQDWMTRQRNRLPDFADDFATLEELKERLRRILDLSFANPSPSVSASPNERTGGVSKDVATDAAASARAIDPREFERTWDFGSGGKIRVVWESGRSAFGFVAELPDGSAERLPAGLGRGFDEWLTFVVNADYLFRRKGVYASNLPLMRWISRSNFMNFLLVGGRIEARRTASTLTILDSSISGVSKNIDAILTAMGPPPDSERKSGRPLPFHPAGVS